MFLANRSKMTFWSIILGIYIAAWFIQEHLFINWDISHLLHATRLMLAGGTYSKDFFIPNPPMILFLYTPPILLSKFLGANIILPFRAYIFFLISISFLICYLLTKQIFSKKDEFIAYTFLVTLATIFLIVPIFQFGQRDCLLLVLLMPYLLAVTSRLQNNTININIAIMVGMLAGTGLAIKPQFLVIPFLIECYYIYYKRNLLAWIRTEICLIVALLSVYAAIIMIFYPDFVFVITPYVIRNYYSSISVSFGRLFLNPIALFCWLPLPFYIALYRMNPYKILCSVLMLALTGFLISYYAQRTLFLYHVLPPFSLGILLLVLLFVVFSLQHKISRRDYVYMTLTSMLTLGFLMCFGRAIWTVLVFNPMLFFGFFTVLFTFLFYLIQAKTNTIQILFYVLLIISISALSAFLAKYTSWYPYRFLITITTLIVLFGIFSPKKHKGLGGNIFIVILGMLVFSFPVYTIQNTYWTGIFYKENVLDTLIKFIETQPPRQSIYVLSSVINYNAPLMDYINVEYAGRFDCLWMINGFAKQALSVSPDTAHSLNIKNKDAAFFLDMLAEDIHDHKPGLIFVDIKDKNTIINGRPAFFDILSYFLESPKFRDEWQHYSYSTTISSGDPYAYNYKLQVYKRM